MALFCAAELAVLVPSFQCHNASLCVYFCAAPLAVLVFVLLTPPDPAFVAAAGPPAPDALVLTIPAGENTLPSLLLPRLPPARVDAGDAAGACAPAASAPGATPRAGVAPTRPAACVVRDTTATDAPVAAAAADVCEPELPPPLL